MAGFADLVDTFIAVADDLTGTLQANVTHYSYASAAVDDTGKITWGSGTARAAKDPGAVLAHPP